MLTFTDEHTREVTVYFMAKKSDAFEAYKRPRRRIHVKSLRKTP